MLERVKLIMAKRTSIELEKKIVAAYEEGMSPYQMVKILPELIGKKPSAIYGVLKRLNIEVRNPYPLTDEQKKNRRKFTVDDTYFNIIDSEHKAYWLGFIYADGYVLSDTDKFCISLGIQDRTHLEKLKDHLQSDYPVNDYEVKSGYTVGVMYSRLLIASKEIKQSLINLGVKKNKTLTLEFPNINQVPELLIMDFIRGYLDGDGCITYGSKQKCGNKNYSIKVTGTLEIMDKIQYYLKTSVKNEQRYPDRNVNNYSITIGGNVQVERILDSLYENATIYLDRKYKRYLELKQLTSSMANTTEDHRL